MSWMFCKNRQGRECGYGVSSACDHPGCSARIDRGLAFVCGGMHDGGPFGCGGYFCEAHRTLALLTDADREKYADEPSPGQLCVTCDAKYEATKETANG